MGTGCRYVVVASDIINEGVNTDCITLNSL